MASPARAAACLAALGALAGCGPHTPRRTRPLVASPSARTSAPPRGAASPLAAIRRLGRPVYCGGHRHRDVALTFDDGPGPYTPLALRLLRRYHERATFFLVGRSVVRFPKLPRRELALGVLGDHTATHADLGALAPGGVRREIAGGQLAIAEAGAGAVSLFRPPYGIHTPAVDREVHRRRLIEVLWSIDSGDSDALHPQTFHQISHTVRSQIRPGSIVLMHENRGQTIRALRAILPWLGRHHLHAVSVPRLLELDPPQPGMLRRGQSACYR
jgi:peptidoglycan/xylan/chitin deacetylase (PgdA/CDA1 family)